MKRALLTMSVLCVACSIAAAQQEAKSRAGQKGNADVERILGLERQWASAEQSGDKQALSRLLADDYKFTDLDGKRGTKTEYLENFHKAPTAHRSNSAGDYEVQVYGNAAIVSHSAVFNDRANNELKARGLDVWVKQGSNWRLVTHQWTVTSGPKGEGVPAELLAKCAQMAFQPEVHSLYGNAAVILPKLENDTMGLPERRGYLLLIETSDSAELAFFERVTKDDSRVYHWEGKTIAELREKVTNYILANRGIACVGAQTKAFVNASLKLSDLGTIPTPLSAPAAFSHMIRKYGDNYLRLTVMLLC